MNFSRPFSLTKSAITNRQNFAAFFADLLQTFRKNFALGECRHNALKERQGGLFRKEAGFLRTRGEFLRMLFLGT